MCIIPKLVYILQTVKVSKECINHLHQPVIRLIKNKLGLLATVGNSIIVHQGLGRCRVLSQEVFNSQMISLQRRLNEPDQVGEITRIRVKQGYALAGLISEEIDTAYASNLKKIWKRNLACLILLRASEIGLKIKAKRVLWQVYGTGKTVQSLLEKGTFKMACKKLMQNRLFFA